MKVTSDRFAAQVDTALADSTLRESLNNVRRVMPEIRARSFAETDEFDELSMRARDIRDEALNRIDHYLAEFEANVTASGGRVHQVANGDGACQLIARICRDVDARAITKSKSMVTEEIELNAHLEREGFDVTETDLGEYIIQLRHETPSHILAPALHVTLDEVAETFTQKHAVQRDHPLREPDDMLLEARQVLRDKFLAADVGITGANFLIAQTGGAVIVTNEGNADLTATLPDTHIVVTGIEKIVPTLDDVGVLLRVLARSAIGERLSNYTSFVHGPRRPAESSGPTNYHVVLVDNGRRRLLGSEFRDMLRCIRCSACLNHCPVYTAIGGHAYGSVYSGPMGAVLTPALASLGQARHLPNASTFCGRCAEVCPVRIPLPELLRRWRDRETERRQAPALQRWGLRIWAWLNRHPAAYRSSVTACAWALKRLTGRHRDGWLRRLPLMGSAWTQSRDLRAPAGQDFQSQWRARENARASGK